MALSTRLTDTGLGVRADIDALEVTDEAQTSQLAQIQTQMMYAENKLVNPSFENNLIGWVNSGCVTGTTLPLEGAKHAKTSGTSPSYVYQDITYDDGDIIFISAWLNNRSYTSGSVGIRTTSKGSTSANTTSVYIDTSKQNEWQRVSMIKTVPVGSGGLRVWAGRLSSGTEETFVDCVMCVNLTDAYGAGSEPTATEFEVQLDSQFLHGYALGVFIVTDITDIHNKVVVLQADSVEKSAEISVLQDDVLKNSPKNKVVYTLFEDGHGFTKTSGAESIVEADTSIYKYGTQSLKLTSDSTSVTADKTVVLNLNNKIVEIDVYIPDLTVVASVQVTLAPVSNYSRYFYYFRDNLIQGWNKLIFLANEITRSGSPTDTDLESIIRMRINVRPATGEIAIANFDRIIYYDNNLVRGKVIFTFDDGGDTVFTVARAILDKYGYAGVAYVITDNIDTAGFMTLDQLKTLDSMGWLIANHTKTHATLTDLTAEDLTSELSLSKAWFVANGFAQGAGHLAVPGGNYNNAVIAEAKKQDYKTLRTIKSAHGTIPAYPFELKIRNMLNTTTATEYEAWLDTAEDTNSLVILCLHALKDPADASTKVLPATFDALVAAVAARDLDVILLSDVFG